MSFRGVLFVAIGVCVPATAVAGPWSGGVQVDAGISDLAGPDAASGSSGLTGALGGFGQLRLHELIELRVEAAVFQHRMNDVHATGVRLPLLARVTWMRWPARSAYVAVGGGASWLSVRRSRTARAAATTLSRTSSAPTITCWGLWASRFPVAEPGTPSCVSPTGCACSTPIRRSSRHGCASTRSCSSGVVRAWAIVALLLVGCSSNETVGTERWVTIIDEQFAVDNEWHANGRFYTADSDRVLVLDGEGTVVWRKDLFRLEAMRATDDGALIVTGWTDERMWLKKLSESGDEVWSVDFAGLCTNHALTLTSDGGFVLAGFTGDVVDFGGGAVTEHFIASFDASGAHRWSIGMGDDEVAAMEPFGNGHVALSVGLSQAPRIAVLNELGVEQWSEPMGGPARLVVDDSDRLFVAVLWGELSMWTVQGEAVWRVRDPDIVGLGPLRGRGFNVDAEGNSVAGLGAPGGAYGLISYDDMARNGGEPRCWRTGSTSSLPMATADGSCTAGSAQASGASSTRNRGSTISIQRAASRPSRSCGAARRNTSRRETASCWYKATWENRCPTVPAPSRAASERSSSSSEATSTPLPLPTRHSS